MRVHFIIIILTVVLFVNNSLIKALQTESESDYLDDSETETETEKESYASENVINVIELTTTQATFDNVSTNDWPKNNFNTTESIEGTEFPSENEEKNHTETTDVTTSSLKEIENNDNDGGNDDDNNDDEGNEGNKDNEGEKEELSGEELDKHRKEDAFKSLINHYFYENDNEKNDQNLTADQKWIKGLTIIDNEMTSLVKALTPVALEMLYEMNLSLHCTNSLVKFSNGIIEHEEWAYRMIDSNGRMPIGLFSGTLSSFGAFDQCLEIKSPDNFEVAFQGKYCLLQMRPPLPQVNHRISYRKKLISLKGSKFYNSWIDNKLAGKFANGLYTMQIFNGICIPSTCTEHDMKLIFSKILKNIFVVDVDYCVVDEKISLSPIQSIAISIVLISAIIVIIASFLDACVNDLLNITGIGRLIKCFSAITNTKKLFKLQITDEKYSFIHGARVLTMLWILIIHSSSVGTMFAPMLVYRFEDEARKIGSSFFGQFIYNGYISTSNFFFISGFVVTIVSLPAFSKSSNPSWLSFIIIRWLRFTPALIGTLCFHLIWPLLGSGPMFKKFSDEMTKPCITNYWTNLLYINNWYSVPNMCLVHSWFLSADFQIHVFAFFVILALTKRPKLGVFLVILLIFAGIIIPGIFVYFTDNPPATMPFAEPNINQFYYDLSIQYHPTYNHLSSYFLGVLIAYIVSRNEQPKIPFLIKTFCWIVIPLVSCLAVTGTYLWAGLELDYDRLTAAAFAGGHRFVFTLGLAWIAYSCATSKTGIIKSMLSSRFFIPLGRLSYCIYLTHILIVWFFVLRSRQFVRFTYFDNLFNSGGVLLYTLFLAFACHLLFESSWSNVVKLMFKSPNQNKQLNNHFDAENFKLRNHDYENYKISNGILPFAVFNDQGFRNDNNWHINPSLKIDNNNHQNGNLQELINCTNVIPNNMFVIDVSNDNRRSDCHCDKIITQL